MSPTKRRKRVSSIRTPRGMALLSFLPLSHLRERGSKSSHLLVRFDDRLSVGAGLLQPIGGDLLADLLEAGGERGARRLHLHALGLELVEVPLRLVLPHLPAARLGGCGGLEDRLLRRLVERVEGRLVDEGVV